MGKCIPFFLLLYFLNVLTYHVSQGQPSAPTPSAPTPYASAATPFSAPTPGLDGTTPYFDSAPTPHSLRTPRGDYPSTPGGAPTPYTSRGEAERRQEETSPRKRNDMPV